jgi:lauroyl/myristoyl acyltransferase
MEKQFLQAHKKKFDQQDNIPFMAAEDIKFILGSAWMFILKLLPSSVRPAAIGRICHMLGTILHKTNCTDAQRVRLHLKYLFQDRWSKEEIESHVRRQLTLTAWNSLVLGLLPFLGAKQIDQLVNLNGISYIESIMARGKPTLMLGCHMGPFAMPIASALQGLGYPVHFIGHAFPRNQTSRLYRKVYYERISKVCENINVINPLNGPRRQLLDIFRKGEILFFLPDQYYVLEPGQKRPLQMVQVDFLGGKVNLETGGLRLGKRFGAEILTVMSEWMDGSYHTFIEPMELPTKETTPAELSRDLRAFLGLIETRIYDQPFLWRDLRRADLFERMGIVGGPEVP